MLGSPERANAVQQPVPLAPVTAPISSTEVKAEARRLGFNLVGIAAAERFAVAEGRLLGWLERGHQGQMGWLDEDRARISCRPNELLPGARSLVVVAAAYSRAREGEPLPFRGRVARYARGRDYHSLLKRRLGQLVEFLRRRTGPLRARIFVDDGPLAEREAAVRAGLGFYGKNTCLLTPRAGSFVLLGALLVDLELQPDPPLVADCGSCQLCLDACPTDALRQPYELDARRCISYLTIELKSSIPSELRRGIGSRIFGCDICQEVCPYNQGRGPLPWPELVEHLAPAPRNAPPPGQSERSPEPGLPMRLEERSAPADLDLPELLQLDQEEFRARFRGSPIRRAGRAGLLRNTVVALGNSGSVEAVPLLARVLTEDPEPLVRAHAAWAMRQIDAETARSALVAALQSETDPVVLTELAGASAD